MIIIKCDLCKKKYNHINSLILYSKKIDYCDKCSKKIEQIKDEIKKEIKVQEIFFDSAIKDKEKQLLKEFKKSTKEDQR